MKSKIRGTFLVVSVSRPCHLEAGSNEGTVITIEGISMCSARRRRWFSRLLSAAVPAFFSAGGRRRRVCRLKSGLEHSVTGQWSDRTLSDPSQFISIVTGHTVSLVSNRQKNKKVRINTSVYTSVWFQTKSELLRKDQRLRCRVSKFLSLAAVSIQLLVTLLKFPLVFSKFTFLFLKVQSLSLSILDLKFHIFEN